MAKKLLFFSGLLLIVILQPVRGYSAFLISSTPQASVTEAVYSMPGNHHWYHSHGYCHSYHYHNHHDHFVADFFHEKDKNWASWSMFFDYFLIGPAGSVCGAIGLIRHNEGAGVGLGIGIIESALEIACLGF